MAGLGGFTPRAFLLLFPDLSNQGFCIASSCAKGRGEWEPGDSRPVIRARRVGEHSIYTRYLASASTPNRRQFLLLSAWFFSTAVPLRRRGLLLYVRFNGTPNIRGRPSPRTAQRASSDKARLQEAACIARYATNARRVVI